MNLLQYLKKTPLANAVIGCWNVLKAAFYKRAPEKTDSDTMSLALGIIASSTLLMVDAGASFCASKSNIDTNIARLIVAIIFFVIFSIISIIANKDNKMIASKQIKQQQQLQQIQMNMQKQQLQQMQKQMNQQQLQQIQLQLNSIQTKLDKLSTISNAQGIHKI